MSETEEVTEDRGVDRIPVPGHLYVNVYVVWYSRREGKAVPVESRLVPTWRTVELQARLNTLWRDAMRTRLASNQRIEVWVEPYFARPFNASRP